MRKYRLPIKHVVVYLGETPPKMRTKLTPREVFEGFTLVNAKGFSPEKWLEENEPSKIIMAILGDYQKKNAKIILKAIFDKLRRVCKTEAELKKYIKQLIIISRMRKLEQLTIKLSEAMPITIDIEKDYLYNLGFKKAEAMLKAFRVKAIEEKAKLEAKAAKVAEEKAKLKARVKAEKKASIQKMLSKKKFTNEEIMEFLNLDKKIFNMYLQEIAEEKRNIK